MNKKITPRRYRVLKFIQTKKIPLKVEIFSEFLEKYFFLYLVTGHLLSPLYQIELEFLT